MAKSKRLPEFPTAWHQEAYTNDLEREVAGRKNRLSELKAFGAHPDVLAQTEMELKAAKDELRRVAGSGGQRTAAKRPRKAAESRKKPSSAK